MRGAGVEPRGTPPLVPSAPRHARSRAMASWRCRAPSTSPARASSAKSAARRAITSPRAPLGPGWATGAAPASSLAPSSLHGAPCSVADPSSARPPEAPPSVFSFEIDGLPSLCAEVRRRSATCRAPEHVPRPVHCIQCVLKIRATRHSVTRTGLRRAVAGIWRAPGCGGARVERGKERCPRRFPRPAYIRRGGLRQAPGHAAQSSP